MNQIAPLYAFRKQKKESFDHSFIRKCCPRRFDKFEFMPSAGASGGLLIIWCSSLFNGSIIHKMPYVLTLKLESLQLNKTWFLSNIYGPCDGPERLEFVNWFSALNINVDDLWIFMGDFNFMRSLENRNLPGGNIDDILTFNDIISNLALLEIPLKG